MQPVHRAWLAATVLVNKADPECLIGANMAVARKVLDKVPEFDPELGPGRSGLWEDTLFSLQLKRAGYRLGMVENATAEHHFEPFRLSRESFMQRAYNEARSSAYVAWHWKHQDNIASVRRIARARRGPDRHGP